MFDQVWPYVTAAVTIASIVASVTPSKADNRVLAVILSVINKFAVNVGKAKNADDVIVEEPEIIDIGNVSAEHDNSL